MTPFEIAIPSHDRVKRLQRQTLRLLADGGVARERITIFVDEPELPEYKAKLDPGLYGNLEPGGDRMRDQYAAMEANYTEGTRLLCIDDDIKAIHQMLDPRTTQAVPDIEGLVQLLFTIAASNGTRLWGLYPINNPFFMKPRTSVGLHFLIGQVYGMVVDHVPELRVRHLAKTDYERTLRWFRRDGAVTRFDFLAADSHMLAPGGLRAADRPDRHEYNELAVDALLDEFPQFVRVKAKQSALGREIRLVMP
jgi:hypothetical protein